MFRRIFSHEIKFERQTSVANVKGTLHPLTAQASQPKRPHPARGTPDCKRWRAPLVHLRCQASAADFRKTGGAPLALAMAKRRTNSTASELHFPPISSPLTTTNRHRSSANNSTNLRPFSTRAQIKSCPPRDFATTFASLHMDQQPTCHLHAH